jgi:hypothetical protein
MPLSIKLLALPFSAPELTIRLARSLCGKTLAGIKTQPGTGTQQHLLELDSHRAKQLPALALDEGGVLRIDDAPAKASGHCFSHILKGLREMCVASRLCCSRATTCCR